MGNPNPPGNPPGNPIRNAILNALQGGVRGRDIRRIKAQAVADRFENEIGQQTSLTVRSRLGEVDLFQVQFTELPEDESCIDIWTDSDLQGEPQFRIFNPPTLTRDSRGDIEVEGLMYREDPIAAIAEIILGGIEK